MISSGVVPRFVQFLTREEYSQLQTQPSASLSWLQPAQTDCFPEVPVNTAGTATENEKSIQQTPRCSEDVQSKSQGAFTTSCTEQLRMRKAFNELHDVQKMFKASPRMLLRGVA